MSDKVLNSNNPYYSVQSSTPNPSISYPPPFGFSPVPDSGQCPFHNSGFGAQPIILSDPNAVSATWVVKHPAPVQYHSHAIQPWMNETNALKRYEAPPNYTLIHQDTNVPKEELMRPRVIADNISRTQSVRCQLCSIECDTIQVYEKHLLGKKHNKNLWKLGAPAQNAAKQESQSIICRCTTPGGQGLPGAGTKLANLEVEQQRLMEGGAAVQTVKERNPGSVITEDSNAQHNLTKKRKIASTWCDVCKIECTSNDDLQIHLIGKKHHKNLQKLKNLNLYPVIPASTAAPLPSVAALLPSTAAPFPSVAAPLPSTAAPTPLSAPTPSTAPTPLSAPTPSTAPKSSPAALATAAVTCTICSVVCSSEKDFKLHLAGQKHATRVKQVKQPKSGASANSGKTCTLCHVVCNSDISFYLHLRSQKHAKRAAAAKTGTGLQVAYPAA